MSRTKISRKTCNQETLSFLALINTTNRFSAGIRKWDSVREYLILRSLPHSHPIIFCATSAKKRSVTTVTSGRTMLHNPHTVHILTKKLRSLHARPLPSYHHPHIPHSEWAFGGGSVHPS
ncbi:hypothetical protein CC78DRAFT_226128 [Lojkania enalia]|uniref:Uncharacterized protein n=1 Tax=Lojkania enalia TaxID=147567 RepID=A0A9P4N3R4_9PLEO|nr:hypothetical protein CC78DRAFT_226128 [Didymosphaeria enalia]